MASTPISEVKENTILLALDNHDSFIHNIVQCFGEPGQDVHTVRNDEIMIEEIEKPNPERICLLPGPCTPTEVGILVPALKHFVGCIPIPGVCLGHQAIAGAFGGRMIRAQKVIHGKVSTIENTGVGVFTSLSRRFKVTRYHSPVIEREMPPDCLEITVWTEDGEIMGVRHKTLPVEGVQSHPEPIPSEHGHALLDNSLKERV